MKPPGAKKQGQNKGEKEAGEWMAIEKTKQKKGEKAIKIWNTKKSKKGWINNNNNNQAFYSQASWGRLHMKPHELKKQGQNKSEKQREKQRAIRKQIIFTLA
jgi:hypothetical protein